MRLRQSCLIAGVLLIVLVLGRGSLVTLIPFKAGPMPASAAQVSEGQRMLKQLVEGARKEGELNWYAVGWMRGRVTKELAQAFNRRFGLSIKIKGDYSRISPKFSQAIMETKTGLTPTFDVMRGPDIRAVRLWQNGGVEHIDKWELLLKEISPEAYAVRDQVSPQDLAGYAFLWGMKRALFSNEAGQGSSPIAHSAARTDEPVREGIVAGLEPFIDTLVVCTLTSLVILSTGAWNRGPAGVFDTPPAITEAAPGQWTLDSGPLPTNTEAGWIAGQGVFVLLDTGTVNDQTGTSLPQLYGTVTESNGVWRVAL